MEMTSAGQAAAARRAFPSLPAGGMLVEQDDDAVLVTLVEDPGRVQHAMTRRDALILIDNHFHRHQCSWLLCFFDGDGFFGAAQHRPVRLG